MHVDVRLGLEGFVRRGERATERQVAKLPWRVLQVSRVGGEGSLQATWRPLPLINRVITCGEGVLLDRHSVG